MQSIFEKYRARDWSGIIGQDKAVAALRKIAERGGFGGRAYWISGSSGTGKTSIARLIASDMAESWHVEEVDAQDCNLDFVRQMETGFAYKGMGEKTGKAWIINEAHGLRGAVLSRFLTAIEAMPKHCAIVFTTTKAGQEMLFEEMADASPLLSRCVEITLTTRGLVDTFAARAAEIADAEGLNGKPAQWYKRLAMDCRCNLRMMLSKIEAGAAQAD